MQDSCHIYSLLHTQTDKELLCVMYEAYLVKGDRVLPASCHGGSLLPSLWHSFSLSLSGGEAGRVREGSKKKIQKYEEMACKRKKSQSDMPWQRHRGGERRDKAEKQQNVWECRRMGERGRWKHKHETLEMLHPWYCHAVFSFHLKSTEVHSHRHTQIKQVTLLSPTQW